MPRLPARVALTVLALACALGWSTLALAAGATMCSAPELRSFVPEQEPSCVVVTTTDEDGQTSVAPLCDARGASAIAPERIYPVSDARIDPGPSCERVGEESAAISAEQQRSSSADGSALHTIAPAVLPMDLAWAQSYDVEVAYPPPTADLPADGVARSIDRPPRA